MPKYWYQKIKPQDSEELSEEDEFNNRICADRKPYFMSYIYPDLNKEYKEVTKATSQGLRRTSDSEERKEYYDNKMPVNDNGCVMNRLCHRIEDEFKSYKNILAQRNFDYEILKSDHGYKTSTYNNVYALYKKYVAQKRVAQMSSDKKRRSVEEYTNELELIKSSFIKECYALCSNEEELCNIVIDICYSTKNSKAFAWEMCGDQIIKNLLAKNNNMVRYLTKDDDGDVLYGGDKFTVRYIEDSSRL